jgi:hypothetical protein
MANGGAGEANCIFRRKRFDYQTPKLAEYLETIPSTSLSMKGTFNEGINIQLGEKSFFCKSK